MSSADDRDSDLTVEDFSPAICGTSSGSSDAAPVITDEYNLLAELRCLANFCKALRTSRFPRSAKERSALEHSASAAIQFDYSRIDRLFPEHRLSPELELLQREANLVGPTFAGAGTGDSNRSCVPPYVIDSYLSRMRFRLTSKKFEKSLSSYRRSYNKNAAGLEKHLRWLRTRYARLIAIRVDLSYRKPPNWPNDLHGSVSFAETQEHRALFLAWLQKEFAVAGYAWRVEYGVQKGYHYHWLVLLDGSKHQRDIALAEQMGEYWSRTATDGKGIYWNCNAAPYLVRAVGRIDHQDQMKFENLLKLVARYLVKVDEVIEFSPPNNARTFGRSATLRITGARRGRRRQKQ